jgi:2-keto-3-deoxy-L-rhamnonate aldolase RhmA
MAEQVSDTQRASSGSQMQLIAITNNPTLARTYQRIGVDRIMIDLERMGKAERQVGRNTWISDHVEEDVSRVREILSTSSLLVRVNPLNAASAEEIDEVIRRGADIVMLPMARSVEEVSGFTSMVGGRARTCLLVETSDALERMDDILSINDLDEVHFGLNDLHLTLGMRCMFEVLSERLLDHVASELVRRRKLFGIGGVGALAQGGPIEPRLILLEHVRLGSRMVILSRSFFQGMDNSPDAVGVVAARVNELRAFLDSARELPEQALLQNLGALRENVARFLTSLK